ncbi:MULTISPECIES: zinc ribbon domain-containing protein [Methanobacterium]|jgi:hypothetical protein|uniref:Zinc ribbon domain-containing protein n=1 Tax=Methanobacterium veterum TaxID=408577 RepID=A0A9E4ZYE6_9EURY|nr:MULTISPECIES: zinc ribbon domain-containing protein [Methanobacterium]MCZ3365611.1 zinc ribbon domain-containing protein [Methanobacterium veterum]MCZ3371074.1 zinc ribbon domain-containing protein [Methanobacterium veterum]
MSYIICDKCGGYYELQPGESPDDFDSKCECGGTLKYVQSLNDDNLQKTCSNCGSLIEDSDEICPSCGFRLEESYLSEKQLIFGFLWILSNVGVIAIMAIYFGWVLCMGVMTSIFKPMSGVSISSVIGIILFFFILTIFPVMAVIALIRRFKNKYLSMYEKKNLNWVAISIAFLVTIIIGIFGKHLSNIIFIGSYLANNQITMGPLFGGFIAGCIAGKSYINGLVNGGIPAGIAGFLGIILLIGGNLAAGQSFDAILLANLILGVVFFIFYFITGSIGGIIGAGIRKRISSPKNTAKEVS